MKDSLRSLLNDCRAVLGQFIPPKDQQICQCDLDVGHTCEVCLGEQCIWRINRILKESGQND